MLVAPIAAFLAGLVPGAVIGIDDLVNHSGSYWDGLWHNERMVILACVAAGVAGVAAVVLRRWLVRLAGAIPWGAISWVAAVVVVLAATGAWFLRPHLQINHA